MTKATFFSISRRKTKSSAKQDDSNVSAATETIRTEDETREEVEQERGDRGNANPAKSFLSSSFSLASDSIAEVYSDVQSVVSAEEPDLEAVKDEIRREQELEDISMSTIRQQEMKEVRGDTYTLAKLVKQLEKQEEKLRKIGGKYDKKEQQVMDIKEKIAVLKEEMGMDYPMDDDDDMTISDQVGNFLSAVESAATNAIFPLGV